MRMLGSRLQHMVFETIPEIDNRIHQVSVTTLKAKNIHLFGYHYQIYRQHASTIPNTDNNDRCIGDWAPSQYKDRLIYVWLFPC